MTQEKRVDGSWVRVIREAGRGPYYLLALVCLIGESLLYVWFSKADSGAERITAGSLMVVVILAFVGAVLVIERLRRPTPLPAAVEAARTLDTPGVSLAEIESRRKIVPAVPDAAADGAAADGAAAEAAAGLPALDVPPGEIISGPDGSYVLARPPRGWSVRQTSVEGLLKDVLGVTDLSDAGEMVNAANLLVNSVLVFEFGRGTTCTPLPDRTRVNGRAIPLLVQDYISRNLRIITLHRHQPPFFIERSLYDNVVAQMTGTLLTQLVTLKSLMPGNLPKTNREMLVAEISQELENILIEGQEKEKLKIEIRATAIRGDFFDYLFVASNYWIEPGPNLDADQMDRDVVDLFDSFHVASVADSRAVESAEAKRADAGFQSYIAAEGATWFYAQLRLAAMRLREIDYHTPEGMVRALSILRPFRTFAGMIADEEIRDDPLWSAMAAAEKGNGAEFCDHLDDLMNMQTVAEQPADIPQLAAPHA